MRVPFLPRSGSAQGPAGGYWDPAHGGPPIRWPDRPGVVAGHRHKFYKQPFTRRSREQNVVLNAGEIMTAPVTCARPETSIREVARIMRESNIGIVPVVGPSQRLLGLITDRDIVLRAIADDVVDEASAADIMTSRVGVVMPKEPIATVLALMIERRIQRIPVVDRDHRLLGIVSLDDIVNRADRGAEVMDALRAMAARRRFWARL